MSKKYSSFEKDEIRFDNWREFLNEQEDLFEEGDEKPKKEKKKKKEEEEEEETEGSGSEDFLTPGKTLSVSRLCGRLQAWFRRRLKATILSSQTTPESDSEEFTSSRYRQVFSIHFRGCVWSRLGFPKLWVPLLRVTKRCR